jgi:hypothetical protein
MKRLQRYIDISGEYVEQRLFYLFMDFRESLILAMLQSGLNALYTVTAAAKVIIKQWISQTRQVLCSLVGFFRSDMSPSDTDFHSVSVGGQISRGLH